MTTPDSAATHSLSAGKAFDAGDFATALERLREHDHTREPRRTRRGKSVSDVAALAIERIRSAAPPAPRA